MVARFRGNIISYRRTSVIQFDEDSPTHAAVYTLDLSQKDLRRLKNNFELIDLDGSGEIDYDEFFEMVGDKRTPYSEALFQFIDTDKSGAISFEEFIQVSTTYCMYSKEDILKFCFNMVRYIKDSLIHRFPLLMNLVLFIYMNCLPSFTYYFTYATYRSSTSMDPGQ
jgi:hypothetical protein